MNRVLERPDLPAARERSRGGWVVPVLVGLGAALGTALYVLPRPVALHLLSELGPLELVSLGVYALDCLLLLWLLPRRPALMGWAAAAVLLIAVAEINPGNRISGWIDAPSTPGDPIGVRPAGVLCIAAIVLGILLGLLTSVRGSFWKGLRNGVPEVRLAAIGAAFLPISFVIDRVQASRFTWHRGYRLEKGIFYASDVVEETLEFLMPFFFFFAILLWSRRRKAPPGEAS